MRIGVSLAEYNDMTPYELNLHIQAYNERLQREEKEGLTLAYLTAYWGRVRKMPSLKSLLNETETQVPKAIKTDDQLLRVVKQLNAAMGGKEVKREVSE